MNHSSLHWLTAVTFGLCCAQAMASAEDSRVPAHTRAQEQVGETVAERSSPYYRFETHTLDSSDGQRRYRIQIGIPLTVEKPEGTLYMLDGNAAIATLTEADLARLRQGRPVVLVAIGYDVDTRNDVVARAYDYTPPVRVNGGVVDKPVVRGRMGGGADLFLEFIATQVKPLVRERAGVQGGDWLWGHSYGGLFALYTLLRQPDAFDGYIAGDPSMWWHDGVLYKEWQSFDPARAAGKHVDILIGTRPRPADRPAPGNATITSTEGQALSPRDAVLQMVDGLRGAATVHYQTFPQAGHGEMIRISLAHALRVVCCTGRNQTN